jgi:hypothetical protein
VTAALVAQQSAVHLSQHPQVQDPGSQEQTPVAQQPQQSQGTLHAQEAPAPVTLATANAPVVAKANIEPIKNLNIASNSKRENSEGKALCLSAEAQTDRCNQAGSETYALPEAIKSARRNRVPARESAVRGASHPSPEATRR